MQRFPFVQFVEGNNTIEKVSPLTQSFYPVNHINSWTMSHRKARPSTPCCTTSPRWSRGNSQNCCCSPTNWCTCKKPRSPSSPCRWSCPSSRRISTSSRPSWSSAREKATRPGLTIWIYPYDTPNLFSLSLSLSLSLTHTYIFIYFSLIQIGTDMKEGYPQASRISIKWMNTSKRLFCTLVRGVPMIWAALLSPPTLPLNLYVRVAIKSSEIMK